MLTRNHLWRHGRRPPRPFARRHVAELAAVDVAMRRLLLLARHGVHFPGVRWAGCDLLSDRFDQEVRDGG